MKISDVKQALADGLTLMTDYRVTDGCLGICRPDREGHYWVQYANPGWQRANVVHGQPAQYADIILDGMRRIAPISAWRHSTPAERALMDEYRRD